MRTALPFVVGTLLSGLAIAAAGCENETSTSPQLNLPDGGGIDVTQPDGAPPAPVQDGGTDAPVTPTGAVTIKAVIDGQPAVNARVLAHDAAGAILSEVKTDATGAAAFATAPAQVTIISPILAPQLPGNVGIVTYTSVAAGDVLTVDLSDVRRRNQPPPPAVGSYSVTWAAQNPSAFEVNGGFGCTVSGDAMANPLTLQILPGCARPLMTLLGVAYDNDGLVSSYQYRTGVALATGATPVATTLPTTSAVATRTVTVSNVPANGTPRFITIGHVSDGAVYAVNGNETGSLEETGVSIPMPATLGDSLQAIVSAEIDRNTPQFGTLAFIRRFAVAPTAAFDFATSLPRITAATLTQTTPKRPDITWTAAAPLTATDGGFITMGWTIQNVGDDSFGGSWVFVVPPGATSLKAPELPADATYAPSTAFGGADLGRLVFVESDLLPDHAAAKKLPVAARGGSALADIQRPLPAQGVVRVTAYGDAF